MKQIFSKVISLLSIVALVAVTALGPQVAFALSFTSSKDTVTRTAITGGTTLADHVITFTLPTGVDFDRGGQVDGFQIDFPATFTLGGTWAAADFSFNDGTSRSISAVAQGAGTIDCTPTGGTNDICVAVDTTNNIFTIEAGASMTASSAGVAVTFTILGTAGNGTLANPSSVAATNIDFKMCDETASCSSSFTTSHSSQIAFAITDNDQVTVSAIVGSSITFDIDTDTSASTENGPTYSVALGTVTTSDTRVSGTTDGVNMIILEGDTSGAGGMVVTVKNANGSSGLVSTSTPADNINSADGAMNAGVTENYGLCVATSGLTGFSRASPYNSGGCVLNTNTNDVQGLTTTGEDILNSGGAPVSGGHAEVVVNAAITTSTVAHNDYADTLTFIATGTF
jgi:hypothetical protein